MYVLALGNDARMEEIHEFESYSHFENCGITDAEIQIEGVPISHIQTVGDLRRIGIANFIEQVDYLIDRNRVIGNFFDNHGKIIPEEIMVRIWENVFEYCNDDDEIEWFFVNL